MRKLSRLKSWLLKRGYTLFSTSANKDTEYYQLNGFPIMIRLASHLGHNNTLTEKYLNVISTEKTEQYILVFEKNTKVCNYRECLKVITSLETLYSFIPDYFEFKNKTIKELKEKISAKNDSTEELPRLLEENSKNLGTLQSFS